MIFTNSCFNPRARAGRDAASSARRWTGCCFNPRARAGRDKDDYIYYESAKNVSIHAPARGATYYVNKQNTGGGVSIHAPARGATPEQVLTRAFKDVSIHAPARGATIIHNSGHPPITCFNPRARAGRDKSDYDNG